MAIDLRLEHIGNGQFRAASKLDFDLCVSGIEAGERVRAKISRLRSVRQNNLFHALIEEAWHNQRGGPRLDTWRHLKSWLLIEVGHCDEVRIDINGASERVAVAIAGGMATELKKRFDTMLVSYDRNAGQIIMRFAKTVNFSSCSSEAMATVMDRIVALICSVIVPGVDPVRLLDAAKGRAVGAT